MAECSGLSGADRRPAEGAGSDGGGGAEEGGVSFLPPFPARRGSGLQEGPHPSGPFFVGACSEDYCSFGPMVMVSLPTPSTSHSIFSPCTTAPTPDGVPVKMTSPAASSTISDSLEIVSGTFQIIWARSPSWRSLPFVFSVILPLAGWPISLAGRSALQGAELSKNFPISHGCLILREAICKSRRVRSMPTP